MKHWLVRKIHTTRFKATILKGLTRLNNFECTRMPWCGVKLWDFSSQLFELNTFSINNLQLHVFPVLRNKINKKKTSKTTKKNNIKVRPQRQLFQLAVDWSSCPWSLVILSRAGFKESAPELDIRSISQLLICFSVVPNLRNKAVFFCITHLAWMN